jgi:hypothetical protein
MHRDQRFDRRPHGIDHTRMQREHDEDLHKVVGVGSHPESNPGQPDDQWMVTPPPYWRAL